MTRTFLRKDKLNEHQIKSYEWLRIAWKFQIDQAVQEFAARDKQNTNYSKSLPQIRND